LVRHVPNSVRESKIAVKEHLLGRCLSEGGEKMLKFNPDWRFTSPGPITSGIIPDLLNLIRKIASQGDRKAVLQHFKSQFAIAAEVAHNYSSGAGWAEEDLKTLMYQAADNAALFLEAFYDGCESAGKISDDVGLPEIEHVNRILLKHETGYQIRPPHLISSNIAETITVEPTPPSLDEQAREQVQNSLKISEEFLASGKYRQAVQEILWLLETISTAFRGIEIVANFVAIIKAQRLIASLSGRCLFMDIYRHRQGVEFGTGPIWIKGSIFRLTKPVYSAT
jgi:hypothetical protein